MRISVMTNGTMLDDDKVDLLRTCGTAKVAVSLDFFEETHDAIRGAGSFRKAVQGIERLISKGVPVAVTAMVQESTAERLEEFKDFCLGELGVSGIRFSSVVPIGKAKKAAPALRLSTARVKELFNKGLISDSDNSDDGLSRLTADRRFRCSAGEGQCFVSADGKVYACHYFQTIGESMGDLSVNLLEHIYREYPQSGAITVDFDWDSMKHCAPCKHFARCLGGCRARARIMADDWYMPDPYSCEMYGVESSVGN